VSSLSLFVLALAVAAITLLLKWAAARLFLRTNVVSSILLGLSPFAYLPGILLVLFGTQATSLRLDPIFYDEGGDGRELLGVNAVFLAAFVVAIVAMSFLDWLTVRGAPAAFSATSKTARREVPALSIRAGWLLLSAGNLAMWFFWIIVYYAIQFPPELDFDG
jgi:hypothetical protein